MTLFTILVSLTTWIKAVGEARKDGSDDVDAIIHATVILAFLAIIGFGGEWLVLYARGLT